MTIGRMVKGREAVMFDSGSYSGSISGGSGGAFKPGPVSPLAWLAFA